MAQTPLVNIIKPTLKNEEDKTLGTIANPDTIMTLINFNFKYSNHFVE